MRSSLAFIKLNEKLKGCNFTPIEQEIIVESSDPYTLTVFRGKAREIYQKLIEIFGEFVVGSVRITLEGNEDVEHIVERALTDILRQHGYIRYRRDEICSYLNPKIGVKNESGID